MRLARVQTIIRLSSLIILPLVWFYPSMRVFAETATTTTEATPQSTSAETTEIQKKRRTGPTKPPGADSNTYKYSAETGLWENDHYTWDPATNQTAPKDEPKYSYNPTTNMWDTTDWRYDAPSGDYVPNVYTTSQAPSNSEQTDSRDSNPTTLNDLDPNDPNNSDSSSDAAYSLFYNAKISNTINSTAVSGDASVIQNTLAGDSLSGNAQAMANVINMLQSSWDPANTGQFATFMNNIDGNVFGDIVIDPTQLPTSSLAASQGSNSYDLDVNVQSSGQINNDIDLAATSGSSLVDSNTQAGNATSGSATAIANVINMINSTIASGKSFVGMLNINGNLNGDILMPADLIKQLLASNVVPKTTIDTATLKNGSLLANFDNNQSINNSVTSNASSGQASVNNNTQAGKATSGNASTKITLLNLTGQQFIGINALLVFVNVQGQWLGMIVNAPAGSTSAVLGNGVGSNSLMGSDVTINGSYNQEINNDITLAATSGDATVSNNTLAGNATSGDATASVNLVNILNSSFSLSDWFGILFINITGNWIGSFGVNTSAGSTNPIINRPSRTQVFKFVAHPNGNTSVSPIYSEGSNQEQSHNNNKMYKKANAVLASASIDKTPTVLTDNFTGASQNNYTPWMVAAASVLMACLLLGSERIISLYRRLF